MRTGGYREEGGWNLRSLLRTYFMDGPLLSVMRSGNKSLRAIVLSILTICKEYRNLVSKRATA